MDTLVYVTIVLLTVAITYGVERQVSNVCVRENSRERCLHLYGDEAQNGGFTWQEAQDKCQTKGETFLKIPSDDMETQLIELTKDISLLKDGTYHVWISGKKSEDRQWYNVNDGVNDQLTSQDVLSQMFAGEDPDKCGFIINTGYTDRWLAGADCNGKRNYTLCQRSGSCNDTETSYNNLCYYLHQDSRGKDWNRARQYCRSYPGRDLADSHITDPVLLSQLSSTGSGISNIWIGITSRKWQWADGSLMRYSKFRGGVANGDCVYLDPGDSGKWAAEGCDVYNTNFICESSRDVTPTPAPTSAPTPAPTPITTTSTTTATPGLKGSTTSGDSDGNQTGDTNQKSTTNETMSTETKYIIIGVAGGVLILIIIIVIAVIVTRGARKKAAGDDTQTYNNHIDIASTISLNSPHDNGNTSNVYSEGPLDQAESNTGEYAELDDAGTPEGYKAGPDGALYSMPKKSGRNAPVYANS